jgi:hypothetical protein
MDLLFNQFILTAFAGFPKEFRVSGENILENHGCFELG